MTSATTADAPVVAGTPAHYADGDIEITPVTPRIGAVISGAHLSGDLAGATVAAIRRALIRHKVVFFHGQSHLDEDSQVAFAARLGELTTAHPTEGGLAGHPRVFNLDSQFGGRASNWHTDVTFVDRPPAFSVLRAVTIPALGGDTTWANTATAYTHLKPALRERADAGRAVHTNAFDYAALGIRGIEDVPEEYRGFLERFTSTHFETEHPLVRVHPESGERALLVGGFARRVVGLDEAEGRALIAALQAEITKPENTVRWRWTAGDLVIWDNRATQHYAVDDYADAPRVVRRVTVAGDVPVGIDGRPSRSLEGDAAAYSPATPVPA